MADSIAITPEDDGQAIPAALAATPATARKPRAARAAKPVPAATTLAAPTEAAAPASEPVEAAAPEPVASVEPQFQPEPEPAVEAAAPAPAPIVPAIAPDPVSTPTAAVPAGPEKDKSIMATTIDNATAATAKAQAFFADANVRSKDAMAKGAQMFEEATAFGKGNVEALVESSKIAAKGLETLGQDAAEFGRKSFEDATAAFKTLATVKSPTEFLKLHSDYVRQSFDALVAETSRSTESMLKLAGEVAQPISNRMAVAAERIKTAA